MSRFVKIRTQLRDVEMVKLALDDLNVRYEANKIFMHGWSGKSVEAELVVKARGGSFALVRNADQVLEAQGDDAILQGQKTLLGQISQRYAYHKVLAEASKAGFSLVEEKHSADQLIRLVVRRWA
ncbi:MAG: DUF1257 domain-containing protein [Thermoflexales bacterium]|nr:DUF1257 domain-containing protein [Thermoflexales bacterium]